MIFFISYLSHYFAYNLTIQKGLFASNFFILSLYNWLLF